MTKADFIISEIILILALRESEGYTEGELLFFLKKTPLGASIPLQTVRLAIDLLIATGQIVASSTHRDTAIYYTGGMK